MNSIASCCEIEFIETECYEIESDSTFNSKDISRRSVLYCYLLKGGFLDCLWDATEEASVVAFEFAGFLAGVREVCGLVLVFGGVVLAGAFLIVLEAASFETRLGWGGR